ncbi:26S proteasome non-ATPase regulatory subunit 5 [Diabrotica virgifera virgifera]|uniref:26S proteasome non-ATPase regulatory subunit 5 n=1 Tax=Diabrotica virgifera virgifera TaxID=50390 RepID=A0A6P7GNN6_DIAVI|nr:26S proteasome non-ATPase regulatory subunit 5 [Diabrotica virgifera virgifera]
MASREDWSAETQSKLLQEEQRVSVLNEIKDHLISIPQSEASKVANSFNIPLVFDCLNNSNTEEVDLACEVLSLFMNNLSIGESTNKYDVPLERALHHPYPGVKIMALNEIHRNVSKEEGLINVCRRISLLSSVIQCVGDSELAVAQEAAKIVSDVGISDLGLKVLVSGDIVKEIQEIMCINELTRLRVYEIVVNISKESEANLELLKSTGIVSQILEELNNNDVLLKMNIVELLTQLGLNIHGYNYLEQNGVLSKLFALIEDDEDQITVKFCEPGILKFFGNMAHWKPTELLLKYPKIFDRLFANIESSDLTIVGITLDTLGIIGVTTEGKCALKSTGNKITYALKTIMKLLSSFPTEIKLRALKCIENLLSASGTQPIVSQITMKWFSLLTDQPMEVIVKYAKNPFTEIKLAGLGIIQIMASQQWGQEEIKNSPGLIEYLLDRNIEVIKECKEVKYEIIKLLSSSTIFDEFTLKRLQKYVKEGPFHVEAITEVAFESNE